MKVLNFGFPCPFTSRSRRTRVCALRYAREHKTHIRDIFVLWSVLTRRARRTRRHDVGITEASPGPGGSGTQGARGWPGVGPGSGLTSPGPDPGSTLTAPGGAALTSFFRRLVFMVYRDGTLRLNRQMQPSV